MSSYTRRNADIRFNGRVCILWSKGWCNATLKIFKFVSYAAVVLVLSPILPIWLSCLLLAARFVRGWVLHADEK